MKEFWDERYSSEEYIYGKEANSFLKQELKKLEKGKILFPCEGEGRNSVFASKIGWISYGFDQSHIAKQKAENLAKENNVEIDYKVGNVEEIEYPENYFDAIAYIYSHFPSENKKNYFKKLNSYLKINGYVIFECFSKKHLEYNSKNPSVGGPRDLDLLFSIDEIKEYFDNFNFIYLNEEEIELKEGNFHNGIGMVIRFVGKKMF
ncbi:MAG: methyltransferase [Candidatus Sericytochromatia bacterium]|nr:MAG: methyltransferase [Candidatus Sericytochromatia bacterium]